VGAQQRSAAITGSVVDRVGGTPISGATVILVGSTAAATADASGRFAHRDLPPGTHVLQARAIGYVSGTWVLVLQENEIIERVFSLEAGVQELAGIDVTGHAERWVAGFEERRGGGRGYFLTERQIKATGARQLSDLLRNVPGVRAICRVSGCVISMTRAARQCSPDYVLDGFPATNAVGPEMTITGVMGIEIYRTLSETPMQFQRADATCGTIVIWTRAGP
jgi:hypothetical protein